MKYLEYSPFEELNALLNSENQGDFRLVGRIEAYSCKQPPGGFRSWGYCFQDRASDLVLRSS
jgi:hypothetical protein